MHILILPAGFILWYLAYKAKPIINDEVTLRWEEENTNKRNKLLDIINNGLNNQISTNFDQFPDIVKICKMLKLFEIFTNFHERTPKLAKSAEILRSERCKSMKIL